MKVCTVLSLGTYVVIAVCSNGFLDWVTYVGLEVGSKIFLEVGTYTGTGVCSNVFLDWGTHVGLEGGF